MKKFYCEKLFFVVSSYAAGVFNKHCLLTVFFFFHFLYYNVYLLCVAAICVILP